MKNDRERATYPQKIQAIRSSGQNLRLYVYLPMPLAAALGLEGGEEVEWELLSRKELRLVRCKPKSAMARRKF